ncbi:MULTISPECIES: 5-methyltetrahydropteroyltriglutamate--homocysteine S-methyltransferase [unclassified Meiothermus]|uniref:5-methyltetrahydropteroyltriglutamate-- homocysteine S-methyltransferase n=1 Tax=unclassified Meiothermus TaxID=370471 RepID=UPI000D7C97C7|nr:MULTISPECIES: 5-methyltetrahydropteroyltriglutamate--homocysteine S-methyltransferase [unclassified Meiothermus]PZA06003.1 5-methyltetrahydropteroyltriglutamate--homocysteine S-methyltransferase [Meiothermus sp. Pnk-1]RYM35248.1 5-methyltetrahydropteroyltriglutamate--homocysteine S-methyltransferase [Meiothermus sp. PNK-Is4]
MPVAVSNLGFPRIGPRRELKFALEEFWSGKTSASALREVARGLRKANWARQHALGITHLPSNDFSLYDHMLDTSVMVGAIPAIYGWSRGEPSLEVYFAMARGSATLNAGGVPALEMTKWFDTNYHFMVPELEANQNFQLAATKPIDEYLEAKALGYQTRPVLVGPVTYLKLAKSTPKALNPLTLIDRLVPVYIEVLRRLYEHGAQWVQMDEPALSLDLDETALGAFRTAYTAIARAVPNLRVLLTSYFGGYGDNLELVLSLPVAGIHLDLVRAPDQLEPVLRKAPAELTLSLGVIDGRNVWRSDLPAILDRLEPVVEARGEERIIVAPSCSLLHVPIDLSLETALDPELKSWLAFAIQKLEELSILGRALNQGREAVKDELAASAAAVIARKTSAKVYDPQVRDRLARITPEMTRRKSPFPLRRKAQQAHLGLPLFPTTTIGSFPQTGEVRKARAAFSRGELSAEGYTGFLRRQVEEAIRWQEEIGLDVLVHGEFERNDMVQYFAERLEGYAFTQHGWVQSYGSRYVRPPILFGDVSRPRPISLEWSSYAQSLTHKPVKGMLTGPVTMLLWSFVRDDLPREQVCRQIALALRDEVIDLERAGIRVIQIDEPALREGLPLRRAEWDHYLAWAVECFRLCSSAVADETQIHTHMCYSEFNDIIRSIGDMDADVISIEASRSKMDLLEAFTAYRYPNQIGPGIYDIHSPRVPPVSEMVALLQKALQYLRPDQLWVNPDCGLKTRRWAEVRPALVNLVEAARQLRAKPEHNPQEPL